MIDDLILASSTGNIPYNNPITMDPMWDAVSFLLDMESGSFKNKKTGVVLTNLGNASIDENKVFLGQKSLHVANGSGGLSTTENVISVGSGNFCLDTYVQLQGNNGGYQRMFSIGSGGNEFFGIFGDAGFGYKLLSCFGSNPTQLYQHSKTKADFIPGFGHIAFDKNGGVLRVFANGIKIFEISNGITLSATGIANIGNQLYGWLNHFRFTKASRWTEDFDVGSIVY